ncbi:MAG: TonB-dependent receptor [Sedimentisphaerales bacterium]|nr:TonB-dependent receptor [Sedimentisphaerales bacterium]
MKKIVALNPQSAVLITAVFLCLAQVSVAGEFGGIRGTVYDKDFDVPLYGVRVQIAETKENTITDEEGNYFFGQVKPGVYTLVFIKDGFVSQSLSNVAVSPGQITEADASLLGEFTEMEEFVVQELALGGGTDIGLWNLRMESPSLMGLIGSELIGKAGVSDAADAMRLVTGATVQDGKYAVIRGLPDRYVNSQLNGVRLPTADEDKRAVQLDQFPSALIESIRVSKTFTPDQQGDASGGAVNVITKGIPEERIFEFSGQLGYNSQATGNSSFLTYKGGGVDFWGIDDGGRDVQTGKIGQNWAGAVGVSPDDAPIEYKWSFSGGGKHELESGAKIGGFATFFYEQDSSFYDDGIDHKYWVDNPGSPMTPQYGSNGTPEQENFTTSLFDVTQGSEEVKWGTLGTLGWEIEDHSLSLLYMYTRSAEDVATLAEDTRGKASLHRYWPSFYGPEYDNYDRFDPTHPANMLRDAAPYIRTETLEYTERTTQSIQLNGRHTLLNPDFEYQVTDYFKLMRPEFDWRISLNSAELYQPDKRQFGSLWRALSAHPTYPSITYPAEYSPFKPSSNTNFGALQRIWKDITEDDTQYSLNLKLPFEQWNQNEGYLKFGFFDDTVKRKYNQDTFGNFGDEERSEGEWENYWSDIFLTENHPIFPGDTDVDYKGDQDISAWYYMLDMPLFSNFNVIGGHRFEKTELTVINEAEQNAFWNPPGLGSTVITPGFYPNGADVQFKQDDILPSIGFEYTPTKPVKLRGSYSETVARQTFKELTPIQQMEYLGADVFIGFPGLKMSSLKNYDLSVDYTPYTGGLVSLSYFYKDIKDPIEYIQAYGDFVYTTPRNYPEGRMSGIELEVRQDAGRFSEELDGITVGANATFIDSEVTLPQDEADKFSQPNIMAPMSKRDMTNAPEHLYNFYVTYDIEKYKTQAALFYTVRGDTLVAGAGQSQGQFIPNVYETEYGTLNMSISHDIKKNCKLKFQAKNLTNPLLKQVYRSEYIGDDVTKTSYRKGIDFSLSLAYQF